MSETPTSIEVGTNPGGLVSIVYDGDEIIRSTNLSTDDLLGVDNAALADADSLTGERVVALYDGDSGEIIATLYTGFLDMED